jgi:hypothetical protein
MLRDGLLTLKFLRCNASDHKSDGPPKSRIYGCAAVRVLSHA